MKIFNCVLGCKPILLRISVFLAVSAVPFFGHSEQLSCKMILKIPHSTAPIEMVETSENRFALQQDSQPALTFLTGNKAPSSPFYLIGRYKPQEGGFLKLNFYLVDYANHLRSKISGADGYAQIMEHFSHKPIRFIEGQWNYSDNSKEYLHNREVLGMTRSEAALNTWSGRQAQKYGFNHAEVQFDQYVNKEVGIQIIVRFYKKPPSKWEAFREKWF